MEHVTRKNARWGYTTLEAETGWVIKSKKTGIIFQTITVPDPENYEEVPVPTSAGAKVKRTSKPRTAKKA